MQTICNHKNSNTSEVVKSENLLLPTVNNLCRSYVDFQRFLCLFPKWWSSQQYIFSRIKGIGKANQAAEPFPVIANWGDSLARKLGGPESRQQKIKASIGEKGGHTYPCHLANVRTCWLALIPSSTSTAQLHPHKLIHIKTLPYFLHKLASTVKFTRWKILKVRARREEELEFLSFLCDFLTIHNWESQEFLHTPNLLCLFMRQLCAERQESWVQGLVPPLTRCVPSSKSLSSLSLNFFMVMGQLISQGWEN